MFTEGKNFGSTRHCPADFVKFIAGKTQSHKSHLRIAAVGERERRRVERRENYGCGWEDSARSMIYSGLSGSSARGTAYRMDTPS